MRGLKCGALLLLLMACDEARPPQVTIFDDGANVTYFCRFSADDEARVVTSTTVAVQAEACLGISSNVCVASPAPGDAICDEAQNVLKDTCVESFFACLSPVGACTEANDVVTYGNGARVESRPAFKLFGPGDPNPCIVGERNDDQTTVYIVRED